ncbi:MAG: hypothetical protein WD491_09245 [Balneolales bacterium]
MFCYLKPAQADGQVLRVLANNTFAGTLNGAALGGATMALTNTDDFAPVRFGVGLGTLTGMGVGVYDASVNPGYVQGAFNTMSSSGYIILVDTFYGVATGTIVGVAVSLLGNNRIANGAQLGAGAGAWAGFSFGMVDAFYISRGTAGDIDHFSANQPSSSEGLVQLKTGKKTQVGFLNPSIYAFPELSDQALSMRSRFGMEFASFSLSF